MGAINTFSNVLPILTGVASTFQTLQNTLGAFQDPYAGDDLALQQLQERQRLEEAQLAQQTALQRDQLALDARQAEEERRKSLRRAVARQRANFGVQGVGQGDGSSEAVLLGLFDESNDELQRRQELDSLRSRALDLSTSQARSLNLLQATQLAERQNLNRLF